MKKYKCPIFVGLIIFVATTFSAMNPAFARHSIVIPYSFSGFGWGTELVVSNTSNQTISPIVVVRNGDVSACTSLGELKPGEIYISLFDDITGWNVTPPIPGVFQVMLYANALGSSDPPFGAGVEIYNPSFGGFSSQQFLSQYDGNLMYLCLIPIIPIPMDPLLP